MTRRGLQILLGMLHLGAAPLFGQVFPPAVEVGDMGASFGHYNGIYVFAEDLDVYPDGTSKGYYQNDIGNYLTVTISEIDESIYYDLSDVPVGPEQGELRATVYYTPNQYSFVVGWVRSSTGAPLGFGYAQPLWNYNPGLGNPYEEAFPDWESAQVKIPLGFAFGLALWASAVALGVPMKWVRELTSAAS